MRLSRSDPKGRAVLAAAALVAAVLGSIHAFSVFLEPLEAQLGASRSAVSLTYSLALLTLTLLVLTGPRHYPRCSAARMMALSCGLAAAGALLAGAAGSLTLIWIGYSVIFGAANGLGYGFGLQIAAQANPGREGLAMGTVTAAYAFGAVLAAPLFEAALSVGGFARAMQGLAAASVMAGLLSAGVMRHTRTRFAGGDDTRAHPAMPTSLPLLWLSYFGGVLAGLMVIGHAAGIATAFRPGSASWLAPAIIALCNLAGALTAGVLADRLPTARLLATLSLVTALALGGLAALAPVGQLVFLGLIGAAYGGFIAAFPAAIAKVYGMNESPRLYGRVFTAWGASGLIGPWFAGYLYDLSGGYGAALWVAAGWAVISALALVFAFPRTGRG